MYGRFISFEGGEGVGKSTQITRVADALESLGHRVIKTREPGGTPGAEAIRALLLTGSDDKWNAQSEALLFAAARADHVARLIKPALERGAWVICDRFLDSSRAYQGGGGTLSDADIIALHAIGSGGFLPDKTIFLDMPVGQAIQRAAERDGASPDRMGSKSADYYDRVSERFRVMAREEPDRFSLISANQSPEKVTADIMAALEPLACP